MWKESLTGSISCVLFSQMPSRLQSKISLLLNLFAICSLLLATLSFSSSEGKNKRMIIYWTNKEPRISRLYRITHIQKTLQLCLEIRVFFITGLISCPRISLCFFCISKTQKKHTPRVRISVSNLIKNLFFNNNEQILNLHSKINVF